MIHRTLKQLPTLLLAILLLAQAALSSANYTAPDATRRGVSPVSTDDPTPTEDGTEEPTVEVTPTELPSATPTEATRPTQAPSPTYTETPTLTATLTETPSPTPTFTDTPTFTATYTDTPTFTPTFTETPSPTPTFTETPTFTATYTDTPTVSVTVVPSDTPVSQETSTPEFTATHTAQPPTATFTNTPLPPTATPTPYALDCTYSVAPGNVYGAQGLVWAFNQANLNPAPDIICLGANSTYSITGVISNNTGLPPITSKITLRGYNAILSRPIAAGSEFRLLYVESMGELTLDSIQIMGGRAAQGGGVFSSGKLTVSKSVIENNSSTSSGGGVYISNGSATFTDSRLQNNRSVVGAGLYTAGGNTTAVTISGTVFTNNQATNTGGGLFNFNANVYITTSQFIENSAPEGAALRNQIFGQLWLSTTLVKNNAATVNGGGIVTDSASVTANNNCFIANTAPSGSAAYTPLTGGTPLNFEYNWWGRSTGTIPGEVFGNIDVIPYLIAAPAYCKSLFSR
jgi:hypothetical protein